MHKNTFCCADYFTYRPGGSCSSDNRIGLHSNLSQALTDCDRREDCNAVYDFVCDGDEFWTCSSATDLGGISCIWNKTSGTVSFRVNDIS